MAMRVKTRRRLLVLLAVVMVAGLAAGGLYGLRRWRLEAELLRSREAGLEALNKHDYPTALHQVGRYVQRHPQDAATLFAYAEAREKTPLQNGQHLLQAAQFYSRVLGLQPQYPEARHRLLELHLLMGHNTEAMETADTILASDSKDVAALRAKTVVLVRQRKFGEALAVAKQRNSLAPEDIQFQLLTLETMRKAGLDQAKLLAYARDQQQAHPGDGRGELLQAVACLMGGDRAAGQEWLRKASARELREAELVLLTAELLDRCGMFPEAAKVLEQGAAAGDEKLTRQLMLRWWQCERWQDIAKYMGRQHGAALAADSELTAIYAVALLQLGNREAAEPLLNGLAARPDDAVAAAWYKLIPAMYGKELPTPPRRLQICQEAVSLVPASDAFGNFLAQAYAGMGEKVLALELWRKTATSAPAWSRPLIEMSHCLLEMGRIEDALGAAQEARRRDPENSEAAIVLAQAQARALQGADAASRGKYLQSLDALERKGTPVAELAPLRFEVLARAGSREEALEALNRALELDSPVAQESLLVMAAISRRLGWGQEQKCYEVARRRYGQTPDLAYAQALDLQQQGRSAKGLEMLLQAKAEGAANHALEWQLAEARYRELIGDGQAKAIWIALADREPESPLAQWQVFAAKSLAGERELRDRILKRLESQIGPLGLTCRIARAQWLLEGKPDEQQIAQAAALLAEVTRTVPAYAEVREQLAACMEQLNNPNGAIEQLAIAVEAAPTHHEATLRLARLLQRKGEIERARTYLDRVLQARELSRRAVMQAAGLLTDFGEPQRAIQLLETVRQGSPSSREVDLMLAGAYRQQGDAAKTEALLIELLKEPDLPAVRLALDFYLSLGREQDAAKVLTLLDGLADQDQAQVTRGDFWIRTGKADRALQAYQSAVAASSSNSLAWRALVLYHLNQGQVNEALRVAEQAAAKLPAEPMFKLLLQRRESLVELGQDETLRPLVAAFVRSPSDSSCVAEAMGILGRARKAGESPLATAAQIRPIADRNPQLLPLQMVLTRLYLSAGRLEDAATVATRTMQVLPRAAEPARTASMALAASGRWDELLAVARRWRAYAPEQAISADVLIASAHIGMGQPRQALSQLEPYLPAAQQSPEQYAQVLTIWAEAKLLLGQPDQVAEKLRPWARDGAAWRGRWMGLANYRGVDQSLAARWLHEIAALVPADALEEQIHLAQAWQQLYRRSGQQEYQQITRQLIVQLRQRVADHAAGVTGGQLQTVAGLCQGEGELQAAEALYRAALQKDKELVIAMNNLAMLLARRDGDLAEAAKLAADAVQTRPEIAAFQDTLGYVQAKRGQLEQALESLGKAVELEPGNCTYRINLAWTLLEHGQREKALTELNQVETYQPGSLHLNQEVSSRLQLLRTRLASKKVM